VGLEELRQPVSANLMLLIGAGKRTQLVQSLNARWAAIATGLQRDIDHTVSVLLEVSLSVLELLLQHLDLAQHLVDCRDDRGYQWPDGGKARARSPAKIAAALRGLVRLATPRSLASNGSSPFASSDKLSAPSSLVVVRSILAAWRGTTTTMASSARAASTATTAGAFIVWCVLWRTGSWLIGLVPKVGCSKSH
jgi:hypothetical protein